MAEVCGRGLWPGPCAWPWSGPPSGLAPHLVLANPVALGLALPLAMVWPQPRALALVRPWPWSGPPISSGPHKSIVDSPTWSGPILAPLLVWPPTQSSPGLAPHMVWPPDPASRASAKTL